MEGDSRILNCLYSQQHTEFKDLPAYMLVELIRTLHTNTAFTLDLHVRLVFFPKKTIPVTTKDSLTIMEFTNNGDPEHNEKWYSKTFDKYFSKIMRLNVTMRMSQ